MTTIKEYFKVCKRLSEDDAEIPITQISEYIETQSNLIVRMHGAILLAERALERATHFKSNEGQQELLKEALNDIRKMKGE